MRAMVVAVIALVSTSISAQVRVEYGKPRDLRATEKVYVWTKDDELRAVVLSKMAEMLPMLEVVDVEGNADVTLTVERSPVTPGEGEEAPQFMTALRVARARGDTIMLYLDFNSHEVELDAAAADVVTALKGLLQGANPGRFGVPDKAARDRLRGKKAMIHTTAGLHPGLTKREVLKTLGRPTRRDRGHSYTETWVYETTDGAIRLVFGGDTLVWVAGPK